MGLGKRFGNGLGFLALVSMVPAYGAIPTDASHGNDEPPPSLSLEDEAFELPDHHDRYIEWLNDGRVGADGRVKGSLLAGWREAQTLAASRDAAFWEPLGPAPLVSHGGTAIGGRTNSIAIDPANPDILYAGAALGGVWKSTNGGTSWTPLTDGEVSLAMGAIAVDPTNSNVVYAGTGEENFAGDSYYGLGVLRTNDGGNTWTRLGETTFVNPAGGGARIAQLLVDPVTPSWIYVGSTYGLFKSTDSGVTWSLKLSDRTTGNGAITDLVQDRVNPAILYAGVSVPASSTNKGVYKSTDFGETWSLLDIGLTSAQIGRIALAISASNPQILYASVSNAAGGAVQMFRLKTTDGGQTWAALPGCTANCNQGSYNNTISVHPTNPNIVYQGAVSLYRSTDGGQTWTATTRGHTDHHSLVFDSFGSLYIGNDGGIWRINVDDSTSDLNSNLNTLQFFKGATLHPSNRNIILGGMQDNSTAHYTGSPAWVRECGGDGAFTAIEGPDGDPDNVLYCSSQNLAIRKTINNFDTTFPATNGLDRAGAAFVAPFVMDPNNSRVLIAATHGVWRTEDATGLWQRNSPADLSSGAIIALAFAPLDSATTYYAGGGGGGFWRTTDTGQTWTLANTGLPSATVHHISVSKFDSATVWVGLSNFGNLHVFYTTNGGGSWTNISGNLPNVPVSALLVDETGAAPVVYVGTDIGVFRSLDNGANWERYSAGMPTVRVEDLAFNPTTGTLVAVTHGRGIWRLNSGI